MNTTKPGADAFRDAATLLFVVQGYCGIMAIPLLVVGSFTSWHLIVAAVAHIMVGALIYPVRKRLLVHDLVVARITLVTTTIALLGSGWLLASLARHGEPFGAYILPFVGIVVLLVLMWRLVVASTIPQHAE